MEPLIIDSIIEKVESSVNRLDEQEKAITEISKKVSVMNDQYNNIENIAALVKKLQENILAIRWPVKEMTEMSSRLATNNELLSNPRKTKQVIFHTAGRLIWIVIGMFLGIVLLIMGWVTTINKLDQFRMHDIMWRYIKLTNHSQNLEYLQSIEILYMASPEKMQLTVAQKELHQKQKEETRTTSWKTAETYNRELTPTDSVKFSPKKKKNKFEHNK